MKEKKGREVATPIQRVGKKTNEANCGWEKKKGNNKVRSFSGGQAQIGGRGKERRVGIFRRESGDKKEREIPISNHQRRGKESEKRRKKGSVWLNTSTENLVNTKKQIHYSQTRGKRRDKIYIKGWEKPAEGKKGGNYRGFPLQRGKVYYEGATSASTGV